MGTYADAYAAMYAACKSALAREPGAKEALKLAVSAANSASNDKSIRACRGPLKGEPEINYRNSSRGLDWFVDVWDGNSWINIASFRLPEHAHDYAQMLKNKSLEAE